LQKYNVETCPSPAGRTHRAISEAGYFAHMMNNGQDIKGKKIGEVLEKAYPIVSFDTPLEGSVALLRGKKWRRTG